MLLAAIASPMTAFAVERGNVDLLMFVLAAIAVVCMDRALAVRCIGYAAVMLAGLLKFYPLVLLLLLLRERLRTCLALGAIAALLLAAFVWSWHGELVRMWPNIPASFFFDDGFGARKLLDGTRFVALAWLPVEGSLMHRLVAAPAFIWLLFLLLAGVAFASAARIALRPAFAASIAAMTRRESLCLTVGAALVCGCFLAGNSIPYRGILLLFAIPGLLRIPLEPGMRHVGWVAVGLMLSGILRRIIDFGFGDIPATGAASVSTVFWLVRELLWWWLIAVLLAVLIHHVRTAPAFRLRWL